MLTASGSDQYLPVCNQAITLTSSHNRRDLYSKPAGITASARTGRLPSKELPAASNTLSHKSVKVSMKAGSVLIIFN